MDFAIPELPVSTRAYYVTNTKAQPHIRIARSYQVPDPDEFNKVLDDWKVEGFAGCVAQQYHQKWGDWHLLCDAYLAGKEPR
jgi:hypothetical protein